MLRLRWVDEFSLLRVAFAAVLYSSHVAVGHAISFEAETRCSSVTNGCVLLYAFFFYIRNLRLRLLVDVCPFEYSFVDLQCEAVLIAAHQVIARMPARVWVLRTAPGNPAERARSSSLTV